MRMHINLSVFPYFPLKFIATDFNHFQAGDSEVIL